MSVFLLPSTLEEELQKMMNYFLWGNNNPLKGIKWLSWDKLLMKKEDGGMGFRNLHAFNLAMLGKHGWRFFTNKDTIVVRVFKTKYFQEGNFLDAQLGSNPSFIWHSIYASQVVVKNDGSMINILT